MALNPRQRVRPLTQRLIRKYKTRQIFSTTISLTPKQKHKLSKCWRGSPISQDPNVIWEVVIKAKQNTSYPNSRLWLVRIRHKLNIWLKCYSVKTISWWIWSMLLAISSVVLYYFDFVGHHLSTFPFWQFLSVCPAVSVGAQLSLVL